MKETVFRVLEEGEERALFDFAEALPERGSSRALRMQCPVFVLILSMICPTAVIRKNER